MINPDDIVVGDLVKLKAGDGIPADGILTEVRYILYHSWDKMYIATG